MHANEIVSLTRDCPAALIPAGTPITLPAGQQVTITQSLGGSYTCYVEGSLVRIDGKDADALGKTPTQYQFEENETTASGAVDIKMTLTAPGCGMGPILQTDVANKVKTVPNVTDAHVEVVFDPPWDQSRMSDDARLALDMW